MESVVKELWIGTKAKRGGAAFVVPLLFLVLGAVAVAIQDAGVTLVLGLVFVLASATIIWVSRIMRWAYRLKLVLTDEELRVVRAGVVVDRIDRSEVIGFRQHQTNRTNRQFPGVSSVIQVVGRSGHRLEIPASGTYGNKTAEIGRLLYDVVPPGGRRDLTLMSTRKAPEPAVVAFLPALAATIGVFMLVERLSTLQHILDDTFDGSTQAALAGAREAALAFALLVLPLLYIGLRGLSMRPGKLPILPGSKDTFDQMIRRHLFPISPNEIRLEVGKTYGYVADPVLPYYLTRLKTSWAGAALVYVILAAAVSILAYQVSAPMALVMAVPLAASGVLLCMKMGQHDLEPNLQDTISLTETEIQIQHKDEVRIYDLATMRPTAKMGLPVGLTPEFVGPPNDTYILWRRFLYELPVDLTQAQAQVEGGYHEPGLTTGYPRQELGGVGR